MAARQSRTVAQSGSLLTSLLSLRESNPADTRCHRGILANHCAIMPSNGGPPSPGTRIHPVKGWHHNAILADTDINQYEVRCTGNHPVATAHSRGHSITLEANFSSSLTASVRSVGEHGQRYAAEAHWLLPCSE